MSTTHTSENIMKLVDAEIGSKTYQELWESWKSMRHNELLEDESLFKDAWGEAFEPNKTDADPA